MAAVRVAPRLRSIPLLLPGPGAAAAIHRSNSFRSSAADSARAMSSSSSTSSSPSPYTTLVGRVRCEREIKRSKFIAIAASVPNERAAMSFLNEVLVPPTLLTFQRGLNPNLWLQQAHVVLVHQTMMCNPTKCSIRELGCLTLIKSRIRVPPIIAGHTRWEQFRYNDDGEPSSTAGKPIYSAIISSGIDMVMVVVIRYFGGIKLGTGGLVRAYGGVASECLKDAPTCLVKPKAHVGMEVPFDLLGTVYHQLQHFQAEDIKQDYDTGKDGTVVVMFKVEYEKIESLGSAVNSACSRKIDLLL